jgi:hypothetical protein
MRLVYGGRTARSRRLLSHLAPQIPERERPCSDNRATISSAPAVGYWLASDAKRDNASTRSRNNLPAAGAACRFNFGCRISTFVSFPFKTL